MSHASLPMLKAADLTAHAGLANASMRAADRSASVMPRGSRGRCTPLASRDSVKLIVAHAERVGPSS